MADGAGGVPQHEGLGDAVAERVGGGRGEPAGQGRESPPEVGTTNPLTRTGRVPVLAATGASECVR
jgi:hypothetical protein